MLESSYFRFSITLQLRLGLMTFGAGGRNRTRNPLLTRQSLIRIELRRRVVPRPGVEPGNAGFADPREIRLARHVGSGGRSRSCDRRLIRPLLFHLSYSRHSGPGRRTCTSDRRHIRPRLWLLSYPRNVWSPVADSNRRTRSENPGPWSARRTGDGGVAGYRSRIAGLMRPRSRLGATQSRK